MKRMKKTSIMKLQIMKKRMIVKSKIRRSMMKILNQLKIKNGWKIKSMDQIVKVRKKKI